jgi:NTP pyrophosphatase (non-canonical NTP hydrolase)
MNYRTEMLRTLVGHENKTSLVHAALGLAGETGEVVDELKKHLVYGKALNKKNLINELGDVRWYFELLCHCLGITIEEVEKLNIEKLRKRYPNGFSVKSE